MSSKFIDTTAIMQVIGCVYNNPSLLDCDDKYKIYDEDFPDNFHKIAFGTIYKLHEGGSTKISINNILDYLSARPHSAEIFMRQKGDEWLERISANATKDAFDYYYQRLKKMTLLRAYDKCGVNVSEIYDPDNVIDIKKRQQQEDQLDALTLEQIAQKIEDKVDSIRNEYIGNELAETHHAGDDIYELLSDLEQHPEVGVPLYGPLINTVTRGARLRKFYIRSAATGVGKSRSLVADACYIGCNKIYDNTFGWISTGISQPTLYIATEQDLGEVQTMMLAFISNVNEEHILNGFYDGDERERVHKAAEILKNSPIYIETLPDFSLQDIEDKIKKGIREHNICYCFYDYIHSSLKILEEVGKKSGGIKLREDNILFMLSVRLKDLCNKYGIFIMSATQLNGDYVESETPDQNLLRGAKSIADKIDVGLILLATTKKDLESLDPILATNTFEKPTLKISVYKNRRGRYKGIYLWCRADLGTCRITPMFATGWDYGIIEMNDLHIKVEEECAWSDD